VFVQVHVTQTELGVQVRCVVCDAVIVPKMTANDVWLCVCLRSRHLAFEKVSLWTQHLSKSGRNRCRRGRSRYLRLCWSCI